VIRVLVPATWSDLQRMRGEGVPAGTEGYAVTAALVDAMGLDSEQPLGADDLDDLDLVVLSAAAEASLLALAGAGPDEPTMRVVVALDVPAAPPVVQDPALADGPPHPATVVTERACAWTDVASVLADDEADEPVVLAALQRLRGDADAAVAALEDRLLGWYDPAEIGHDPAPPGSGAQPGAPDN
jgi:hypothetical protein